MNAQRSNKIPQKSRPIQQQEAENRLKFEAGKFCLDVAKLVFGGVIIAGLMKQELDYAYLFVAGIMAVAILMFLGFILIISSK